MGRISPARRAFTIRQRQKRRAKIRRILERMENADASTRQALLEKLRRISPLHPMVLAHYSEHVAGDK